MKIPKYLKVVGISYSNSRANSSPIIEIKGELCDADEIVKIAKRYGVPIVERPTLARSLFELPLLKEIPSRLFEAVASIFFELER